MDGKKMRKLMKEDLKDGLRVYSKKYGTWGTIKYDEFIDIDGCKWESPYDDAEHKWNFMSDNYICGNCTWSSNVLNTLRHYLVEAEAQSMEYFVFASEGNITHIVYCEKAVDSNDGINILTEYDITRSWSRFIVNEHEREVGSREIKNDQNMYISNIGEIYQVLSGNMSDCNGRSIPHTFKVRPVGFVLDK